MLKVSLRSHQHVVHIHILVKVSSCWFWCTDISMAMIILCSCLYVLPYLDIDADVFILVVVYAYSAGFCKVSFHVPVLVYMSWCYPVCQDIGLCVRIFWYLDIYVGVKLLISGKCWSRNLCNCLNTLIIIVSSSSGFDIRIYYFFKYYSNFWQCVFCNLHVCLTHMNLCVVIIQKRNVFFVKECVCRNLYIPET